jgi:hypothetical protein
MLRNLIVALIISSNCLMAGGLVCASSVSTDEMRQARSGYHKVAWYRVWVNYQNEKHLMIDSSNFEDVKREYAICQEMYGKDNCWTDLHYVNQL